MQICVLALSFFVRDEGEISMYPIEINGRIESYLLPQQTQHIDYLMTVYNEHVPPKKEDYENFS